jgi:O-antigen/teichoic acid export membrane protein
VRFLAASLSQPVRALPWNESPPAVLSYRRAAVDPGRNVYSTALVVGTGAAILAGVASALYAFSFTSLHYVPGHLSYQVRSLVLLMGAGLVFRILSDVPGAVLQARGSIALDNRLLIGADIGWACITLIANPGHELTLAGFGFLVANGVLLLARALNAAKVTNLWVPSLGEFHPTLARQLIAFGLLITLGQVADFLYAPTDYILINHFLGTLEVGIYTPAVQIDAALLLLVAGLASVLLPKAAVAHAGGDARTLRHYYVTGTLVSVAVLTVGALASYLLAPKIFRLWLGEPMVPTQRILPLVLIHTVVGGSSAVGRSILLGMGKVKPFAIAALIAGIANVILSYCFVKYLNLGLRGIIYGTICVVTVRCAVWLPWYVLRSIRGGEAQPTFEVEAQGQVPV